MSNEDARRLSTSDIAATNERREGRDRPVDVRPHVDADRTPLFAEDELGGYRTRWSAIQTGFVDEPRRAVEEADTLVAELMQRLAESFAGERRQLEAQWERSENVSTEDLRLAMQRYRSFFERLLSI